MHDAAMLSFNPQRVPSKSQVYFNPSSTLPLQSLSRPSATSTVGVPGTQAGGMPAPQPLTLRLHTPRPTVVGATLSSTLPLQSLSLPSHSSAEGAPATHTCFTPPEHDSMVRAHAPVPQVSVP